MEAVEGEEEEEEDWSVVVVVMPREWSLSAMR